MGKRVGKKASTIEEGGTGRGLAEGGSKRRGAKFNFGLQNGYMAAYRKKENQKSCLVEKQTGVWRAKNSRQVREENPEVPEKRLKGEEG